jgi:molybdenum cofactor cytidylyltransferase
MNCARVGVVVLAAGESRRFGAPKLLALVDGVALIRRAALAAKAVGTTVVVVIGAHRDKVEPHIADLKVERAFNPDWANGMGSSIACGVAKLDSAIDAALIALADQPLIGKRELLRLIGAHAAAPERIIAAQFSGLLGPPCLFPRQYFDELVALGGAQGARAVLARHADRTEALPMPAAAIDIDTPQDLAMLPPGA